jgi:DNA-binding NtrC family response regulator
MERTEPKTGSPLDLAARQMLVAGMNLREARNELWRQMIAVTLTENRANLCRTARALRVHRNTLNRLIILLKLRDLVSRAKASQRAGWKKNAAPKRLDQSHIIDPRKAA